VGSDEEEEDHFHKACSATYIQHCAAAAAVHWLLEEKEDTKRFAVHIYHPCFWFSYTWFRVGFAANIILYNNNNDFHVLLSSNDSSP
jgi:hypothetical protein